MPTGTDDDPFDDLLGLEDTFYKEGYDAGVTDGEQAGLIEGKLFGIEKGYEKALELGRLNGRAMIWQMRQGQTQRSEQHEASTETQNKNDLSRQLKESSLPKNTRLAKHIDGLLAVTDDKDLRLDNSDEAVTEFDDRLAKAQAKAKVIAAIVGESVRSDNGLSEPAKGGIEESMGLNARH